jgi:ATP-dependent helicase/nuclease subunit A
VTVRLPPDHNARQQALGLNSFIVQAPAGSGKTELLSKAFLLRLTLVDHPEEVLGITFTVKATAEMHERIGRALFRALDDTPPEKEHERDTWELARKVLARDRQLGWGLAKNPSRLRIVTIDKLNGSLSAQLPVLSGMGGHAQIEEHPHLLYQEAIRNLFAELEDADEEVQEALSSLLKFAGNRLDRLIPLLEDLLARRDQWWNILGAAHPLRMEEALADFVSTRLAFADSAIPSDLRRDLVSILRDGSGVAEPLAWAADLTEWPDAAPEELDRWRDIAGVLLTQGGTLVKRVTVTTGFPPKQGHTARMKDFLETVRERGLEEAFEGGLGAIRDLPDATYPEDMDRFRETMTVALYRLIGHLKVVFARAGKVDFVEVAARALQALGGDDEATDVLQRLDYTIKHILADEFQDTSVSQVALLRRLTAGWEPGDGRTLFLVGDPQQSIYAFRQAEVRLFMEIWRSGMLSDNVPLERVVLTTNFRSQQGVVEWNNATFRAIFPALPDPYTAAVPFEPSEAMDDSGDGEVQVHPLSGDEWEDDEAALVAQLAKDVIESHPGDDIAIIVRTRSHLKKIVPALKEAGVPFAAQDIEPIGETSPVYDVISLVRALNHPLDRLAWVSVLRAAFVGLSWADVTAIGREAGDRPIEQGLRAALEGDALSDDGLLRGRKLVTVLDQIQETPALAHDLARAVESAWYALGGPECVTEAQALDVQVLLGKLAERTVAGQLRDMEGFEATLRKLYATPETGVVQIMTMHAAKGLEFDHVIIPGLGRRARMDDPPLFHMQPMPQGFIIAPAPARHQRGEDTPGERLYKSMGRLKSDARKNEALRLLYVALTRPKKRMHLLGHAGSRPEAGSLLQLLWPAIGHHFEEANAARERRARPVSTSLVVVPRVRRIRSVRVAPVPAAVFIPREDRAHLPSEVAIRGEGAHRDVHAPILGTVYHYVVERIAREGVEKWSGGHVQALAPALAARFRHLGASEAHVPDLVQSVIQLATNTLDCPTGRWILANHEDAAAELAVAGYLEGQWIARRIDRTFVVDGCRWIIDWKSAGADVPGEEVDAFLAEEMDLYRDQLDEYAVLLRERGEHRPIRKALYYPALRRLAEVA